ncbi:MAG TPA: hypothetical protein VF040_17080 [Ktedonobacterales bacterium]
MSIPILIVNNDRAARTMMRQSLEAAGHTIMEADDVESGLAILRTSQGAMVTLFTVALFNNIMTGTDGVAFLGAAAWDSRAGHEHAFVIVTPTPEHLEAALGRLLAHLSVPILAEPFTVDDLVRVVDETMQRLPIPA